MIAAIESASTDLSVALVERDGTLVAADGWTSAQRQGHELLPRLLDLLARRGADPAGLVAVAVGLGPGSFTGLRVGMSVAKGLAFASGLPIVGVPSLAAWLASEPGAVAAVARAGAREAYVLPRDGGEVAIADRDALADRLAGAEVVAPVELVDAFGLDRARPPHRAAAAVGQEAARRLADGSGDDLARLEPVYLRAPRGIGQQSGGVARWP